MNSTNNNVKIDNIQKSNVIQFPINNIVSTSSVSSVSHTHGAVDPIKSKEEIERIKEYFYNKQERYSELQLRDYCMWILGINCARRISDMLELRISDIMNNDKTIKTEITLTEKKTGKKAYIYLVDGVRSALSEYLSNRKYFNINDYLFKSMKGNGHISRQQAWKILDDMSKELNLKENVGCHTMRKTWVYSTVTNNINNPYILGEVSNALNHSDLNVTFRYCGYNKDQLKSLYQNNEL